MIIRSVSLLVVRGRRKGSGARTTADSSGARRNAKQTGGGGGPGGGGRRCSSCGRGRGGGGAEAAEEEAERWRRRRIRRMKLRAEREAADGRCPPKVVEWLRRHTHFDRREIECLWRAHWRLAVAEAPSSSANPSAPPFGTTPLLDRHTFRHLMHTALGITDDAILERLFAAFAGGTGTTASSSSSGGGGGGGAEGGGGGGWTNTGEEGTGAAAQGGGGGGGGGSQSPPPPTHGPGASGGIDARRWVLSLSVLLRGTPQEKRALCFHAYDLNGDGALSRDEVARLLRHSLALGRRRSSSPSSGGGGTAAAKVQRGVRKGEGGEGGGEEDRGEEEGGGVKEESSVVGGAGGGGGGGGGRRRSAADDEEEEEGEESVKELAEVALARLDVDGDGRVSAEDFERAVAAEPLLLEALGPCLPEREAAQAFMEYIVTCAGT